MTTRTIQHAVVELECDRCHERMRVSLTGPSTPYQALQPGWAVITAHWRIPERDGKPHASDRDERDWTVCPSCYLMTIAFLAGAGRDVPPSGGADDVPDGAEASGGGIEVRSHPMCEMNSCTQVAEIDIGPRMVCAECAAEIDHARRLFRELAGGLRQKRPEHVRLAAPPALPPASPVPDFARAALESMRIRRRSDVCACGHLRALHDMDGRLSNGARSQRCTAYVALPYRDDGFIDANGRITTCTCDHFRSELELDAAAGDS